MNTDTLLIVVISSTLGAIVLLCFLIRAIRSISSTSNPLPPPQPLAHHREQELVRFYDSQSASRPESWYHLDHISTPHPVTDESMSSLLAKGFGTHSHRLSGTDEGGAGEYFPIPSVEYSETLAVPNPRFHKRPESSSSLASSSEHLPQSSTPPPGPSEPPGPMPVPRPRMSSSSMGSYQRQRPLSMSSMHSIQSKLARRGLPHRPNSQMQIVLPAPLASDTISNPSSAQFHLDPQSMAPGFQGGNPHTTLRRPISRRENGDGYDRRSMVDRWVPTQSDPPIPDLNSCVLRRVSPSPPSPLPEHHSSTPVPVPPIPPVPISMSRNSISG